MPDRPGNPRDTIALIIGISLLGLIGCGQVKDSNTPVSKNGWTYVDGSGVYGINKITSHSADTAELTVFNAKLYATWAEEDNGINQVRVAVYNGNNAGPAWSFIDGNTVKGINKDSTKFAIKPQLTVFNSKLYAAWAEDNGTAYQIRVVVYNDNDASPAWTFVDGNASTGINKDCAKTADAPQITVFSDKLYAIWKETDGTKIQARVAVYNGNDLSPAWTFVDGGTTTGINKDTAQNVYAPQLTVFNSKLYATWKEETATNAGQIWVAVYNGNDLNPAWTFISGHTTSGINKDSTKNALYPQLTVFNSKLYAAWEEQNGTAQQIRVAVYNDNDASPAWSFVDGNTANGINKDSTKTTDTSQLTVFDSKLYATWVEANSITNQVRVAVYNGDDAAPAWSFVDGDTASGINKDETKDTDTPQLTAFNEKLYACWTEIAGTGWQVRVAVKQ